MIYNKNKRRRCGGEKWVIVGIPVHVSLWKKIFYRRKNDNDNSIGS